MHYFGDGVLHPWMVTVSGWEVELLEAGGFNTSYLCIGYRKSF